MLTLSQSRWAKFTFQDALACVEGLRSDYSKQVSWMGVVMFTYPFMTVCTTQGLFFQGFETRAGGHYHQSPFTPAQVPQVYIHHTGRRPVKIQIFYSLTHACSHIYISRLIRGHCI